MTVDLSLIITDLENKIAAADSNTPILNLLQMVTAAERLTGGKNVYDSAGLLPTGNQYVGTVAMTADGTIRVYSGESGGWDTLDSSTFVPYTFQGSTSGYATGSTSYPTIPIRKTIDKFPFASDANSTQVGNLNIVHYGHAAQSSKVAGYASGGRSPAITDAIDKFLFATDGNEADVGNLTVARWLNTGQSSEVSGYTSGGGATIDKFPYATDTDATDVGDLFSSRSEAAGQSSDTNGYASGGHPDTNIIQKFPFSTDTNASDVGDLTVTRAGLAGGQSSDVSGYTAGGDNPNPVNTIDKFPFSTDANATDVGDLTFATRRASGQSSTTYGYLAGHGPSPSPYEPHQTIQKFSFSSDGNATDVGDLVQPSHYNAGNQV